MGIPDLPSVLDANEISLLARIAKNLTPSRISDQMGLPMARIGIIENSLFIKLGLQEVPSIEERRKRASHLYEQYGKQHGFDKPTVKDPVPAAAPNNKPLVAPAILPELRVVASGIADLPDDLKKVAGLISEGLNNFEIADRLGSDVNDVGIQVAALYKELGLGREHIETRRPYIGKAYKVLVESTAPKKDPPVRKAPAPVEKDKDPSASQFAYLELLGRVKEALDTAQEILVPIDNIRPFLTQPREYFNADSIRRLSASIDAGGQTSSGMIRHNPADLAFSVMDTGVEVELRQRRGKTDYELIDGERRWRGVGLIPESRRPLYRAKLIVAEDDVIQYLISGITNFNREGHTPVETMKTIERHLEFGFPMPEIAKLLGISLFWAEQIHGLRKLSPDVIRMLDPSLPKGKMLPVTAAIHIAKIDQQFQAGLAQRVINKDVTLGRLRSEVVRVAETEGVKIRVREIPPDQQWNSFGKKVDLITRTSGDAEVLITKKEVNRFVEARPEEAKELLGKIKDAKESLSAMEEAILEAQNRGQ